MSDLKIEKQASNISNFKVEVRNTEDTDFFSNLNKTNSNFKEVFEDGIKYDLNTLFENFNISFENDVKYWAVINESCTENEFLESVITYYLTENDLNKIIEKLENGFLLSGIYVNINGKMYHP